jgi:hypothetical protein
LRGFISEQPPGSNSSTKTAAAQGCVCARAGRKSARNAVPDLPFGSDSEQLPHADLRNVYSATRDKIELARRCLGCHKGTERCHEKNHIEKPAEQASVLME